MLPLNNLVAPGSGFLRTYAYVERITQRAVKAVVLFADLCGARAWSCAWFYFREHNTSSSGGCYACVATVAAGKNTC